MKGKEIKSYEAFLKAMITASKRTFSDKYIQEDKRLNITRSPEHIGHLKGMTNAYEFALKKLHVFKDRVFALPDDDQDQGIEQ